MTSAYRLDDSRDKAARQLLSTMVNGARNFRVVLARFASGQAEFSTSLQRYAVQARKDLILLNCLSSEMDNPFSTVGSIIDEAPSNSDMLTVIRQVENRILQPHHSPPRRTLLLVENAHYMDQESAYILTQLVQGRSLDLILITSSPLHERSNLEPFESLGGEHPLVLGPLSDAEMARVLEKLTDAPPTAGSLALMRSLSGGIYEIFYILCDAIKAEGCWQIVAGNCVLLVEHLRDDPKVSEEITQLFEQIERDESKLISALAFGGQSPLASVQNKMPQATLCALESGLLILNSKQEVRVSSTLLSSRIVRTLSPAEADELFNFWIHSDSEQFFANWHRSLWSLAAGQQVPESELIESAEEANDSGHYKAAHEIATAPAPHRRSKLRRIQELRAIAASGQYLETVSELEQISIEPLLPVEVESLTAAWAALLPHLFGHRWELENAKSIWSGLLEKYQLHGSDPLALRIRALKIICDDIGKPEFIHEMREILALEPPVDIVFLLLSFAFENMTIEVDAPEVQIAIKALAGRGSFEMRVSIYGTGILAEAVTGTLSPDLSALYRSEDLEHSLLRHISALGSFKRGWQAELKGQVDQCGTEFIQASADFDAAGMSNYAQISAINVLARNPRLQDPTLLALVDDAKDSLVLGSPLLKACGALAVAVVHHANPDAWTISLQRLVKDTNPSVALQVLWHVHRFQNDEARTALSQMKKDVSDLAQRTNSPRYSLIGEVLSKVYDSPETLITPPLSESFRTHPEIAGVGWAAVLASESVDDELAAEARRHLYGSTVDYSNIPVVYNVLETHGLSPRELDTAKCAARGLSNKQIAIQLNLSVRTIEGHLYRAFSKLGLQDRQGLVPLGLE